MKKILLSFSLIAALAVFATFSRRNVGVGADRFLSPSVSVLATGETTGSGTLTAVPSTQNTSVPSGPVYVPKRVLDPGDGGVSTVPPQNTSPTHVVTPSPAPKPVGQFKDGTYTGLAADAFYGNIQVQAVIQNGKLADVIFLQHPNDRRTSIEINTQAMPILKSEAIQIQSGNVDIVSGATDSSLAFRQSMSSALAMAKN